MEIDLKILPTQFDDNLWNYTDSVSKCKNLYSTVRKGGTDLVIELLHAHEMLVNKKIPGETWGEYCEEIGVTQQTILNWFNKYQLSYTKTGGRSFKNLKLDEPLEVETKAEVKITVKEVKQNIKNDELEKEDLAGILDTVADKIKEGIVAPGIVNKIATVARIAKKENAGLTVKTLKPEFERLRNHAKSLADGLALWAAGGIEPKTEEDFEDVFIIRAAMPMIITHSARLGIDIEKVLRIGMDKQSNKKGKANETIIDIEPIKNTT